MPKDFALAGGWMGWFGSAWSKPLGRCSRKRHRARHSGGPCSSDSEQAGLPRQSLENWRPTGRKSWEPLATGAVIVLNRILVWYQMIMGASCSITARLLDLSLGSISFLRILTAS